MKKKNGERVGYLVNWHKGYLRLKCEGCDKKGYTVKCDVPITELESFKLMRERGPFVKLSDILGRR